MRKLSPEIPVEPFVPRQIRRFVYELYPKMPGDIQGEAARVREVFPVWKAAIEVPFQNPKILQQLEAISKPT